MKILAVIPLLFISSISVAEFGKVVDADGYVNVREAKNLNSKIVGQVSSGDFVYVHDEDMYGSPWVQSHPQYDGTDSSGYIHKSRLKFINQNDDGLGTEISMSSFDQSQSMIRFTNDNNTMSVTIRAKDFDYQANENKFTKQYYSESWGNGFYLTHYKGQRFWGTDGTIPQGMKHYKSITVRLNNNTIEIPKNNIESLFNVDLRRTKVFFDEKTDSVYISAIEGDGAGTYRVLFAIENGRYVDKTVVYGV